MHEIHRVSVRSRGFILSLWRGIPRIAWVTAFYLSFPMLMDVLVVSSLRLLWIMLLQASFHPWTFCWVWTFISVEYNTQEWNCLVRRNVYVQSNSYSWAVFKSACTSFHSSQQCVRGSVVPHLSQHLILSEEHRAHLSALPFFLEPWALKSWLLWYQIPGSLLSSKSQFCCCYFIQFS